MHAVIETGGKQYRVAVGDTLEVERITLAEGKKNAEFPVLLVEDGAKVEVGRPHLKGARVTAEVLGEKRGEKIVLYRYKRRKGFDRKTGHRQELTTIRITDIKAG